MLSASEKAVLEKAAEHIDEQTTLADQSMFWERRRADVLVTKLERQNLPQVPEVRELLDVAINLSGKQIFLYRKFASLIRVFLD